MEYTHLGSTGLRVSRICLGMMSYGSSEWRPWVLDEPDAEQFVRAAVEGGITFFDTADVYSAGASEEATGRLLRKLFRHRDDYVLATGEAHSVREFVEKAFGQIGTKIQWVGSGIDEKGRDASSGRVLVERS